MEPARGRLSGEAGAIAHAVSVSLTIGTIPVTGAKLRRPTVLSDLFKRDLI